MTALENLPNAHFQSISDFVILEESKPLGSGSFGIVRKGIHKMTNKSYAIKIIKLESDTTESELLLLSREISIHYKLNHPHIIKLWAVLSQGNKLYMVMDYAEHGNLFSYLNRKGGLSENQSFRIFYQVLEALEYMHKNDVFHRDIKPENILLDHHMNVKICDFGWVADDIHRKRTTFCGTYEYMAPQMIAEIPYDYRIDIWALGILLYELNHGKAPFQAQTIQTIKHKFQKGVYQIKQDATESFKILIVSLLQFQPTKRLEISSIKKCEWVLNNKKYFQTLAYMQLKNATNFSPGENSKSSENAVTCSSSSKQNYEGKENRKMLLNNYISNIQSNYAHGINSEDDRKKKLRKKYKTLEEEDLYCIAYNTKGTSKQANNTKLQPISENTAYKGSNLALGINSNITGQKSTRKKKIGSARGHTRTESSELLINKFNKIVFHATDNKSKLPQKQQQEKRKKNMAKRT